MLRDCSAVAFAGLLVGQLGCASQLDFDAVSAGSQDAGHDASSALDAGQPRRADTSSRYQEAGPPPSVTARDAASASAHAAGSGGDEAALDAGSVRVAADIDAGAAPTPPSTSFCRSVEPAPTLCDDFEGDGSLSSMWNGEVIKPQAPSPAGAVAADTRAAHSGAASLLAVVDPAVPHCSGCDLSVCVRAAFYELQGHKQLTVEFDMRVEQIDWHVGRRSALLHFYMGSPERGYTQHLLQLQSAGEQAEVAFVEIDTDGQVAASIPEPVHFNHGPQPGPVLQEWVHVKYVLDAVNSDGSGNALRLTVGDSVLADGLLRYGLRYREPELELGLPFVYTAELDPADTNEGWQVRYDNVLVVIEPKS